MIDKSLRKATAERYGDLIVVHMHGGGDCLWLNMYLDGATGQMTCDSDIGSYAYHWGRHIDKRKSWLDFCCEWLSCEEWLLRKCCGERKAERKFDRDSTIGELRLRYLADKEEDEDAQWEIESVLEATEGYDKGDEFAVALNVAADMRSVDLPEEWWTCIVERYTPWQLRFAEICREVIVPAIREMDAMDTVDEVPTVDAVEVVRCRDCDDYCSRGVAVAKKETTTGEDINVPTNGGEKDGHDQ